jgi:hypothetical protein
MSNAKGAKHAVILSGGGANGAYEIGVLRALFAGNSEATQGEPLDAEGTNFRGRALGRFPLGRTSSNSKRNAYY